MELSKVQHLIERQITCNMAIANEGMKGGYGLGLGKLLVESYPDTTLNQMKAYAAAGSEARMGDVTFRSSSIPVPATRELHPLYLWWSMPGSSR